MINIACEHLLALVTNKKKAWEPGHFYVICRTRNRKITLRTVKKPVIVNYT